MVKNIRYDDPSLSVTEAVLEKQYDIPRGLMSAIRTRGERSNNNQVSPVGAKGIYQFMPATWDKFADPGTSPTDPEAAAVAAARYLAYGMKRYGGNVGAVVADYNGGPRAAKAYIRTGDPGNKETRGYVQRVMGALGRAVVTGEAATPSRGYQQDAPRVAKSLRQPPQPSLLGEDAYNIPDMVDPLDVAVGGQVEASPYTNLDVDLNVDLGSDMDFVAAGLLDDKVGSIVDEVLGNG